MGRRVTGTGRGTVGPKFLFVANARACALIFEIIPGCNIRDFLRTPLGDRVELCELLYCMAMGMGH